MTALLAQDPEYRDYFKAAWIQAMNHQITPPFLRERFEHYREIARSYGVETFEYLPLLEAFLAKRAGVLREHAAHYLQTPTVSCRLATTGPVLLDGHPVNGPFEPNSDGFAACRESLRRLLPYLRAFQLPHR
jgi:hypothetical protein